MIKDFEVKNIRFVNNTDIKVDYSYISENGVVENSEVLNWWEAEDPEGERDFEELSEKEQKAADWPLYQVWDNSTIYNPTENKEIYDCGTTDGLTIEGIKDFFSQNFDGMKDQIEEAIYQRNK
ncbi:hypothetical protein PUW59_05245 [Lactobacillus mulieris]|nr:hypothetical protein PUW59_05245 [Lactobacillus mulieris]